MTSYSDLIAKAAGTGGVEYDGDFLTNSTIHDQIKQIGVDLGEIGAGLGVHEDMKGATAEAAREQLAGSRAKLQGTEDALNSINGAAVGASATIDSGKSNDPAVKSALAQSEAEYAKHGQGAGVDDEEVEAGQEVGGGDGGGTNQPGRGSGSGTPGGSAPTAPSVSTAQPAAAQQPMQQATPMATGQPMGQPIGQAGGGMQQPGGMPISSPRTTTGSPDYSRMIREAIAEEQSRAAAKGAGPIPRGISPKADPSASDSPSVVAAPVPTGNPTLTGGAVDPAQTSGRTASTTTSGAPGAGVPAKAAPLGSMGGGMMGGMGPMGGMGGSQPPAGPQGPPKIKRDRETERVLDGTAARDEALIASILTDSDLITSGTDDGSTDELLDDLRNEPRDRPTAAPELPPTPPVIPRDDEPSAPPQRPGEPSEDEKW